MIYKNNEEFTGINKNINIFDAVYKGAVLVWEAVRSCFGSGVWVDKKMWLDKDPWKNN